MKTVSLSSKIKEKRNYIEIKVYHDYFLKKDNNTYTGQKVSTIQVKKLTKEEIIKAS